MRFTPFTIATIAVLGLALCDMPYGYYTFTRIIVCLWCAISGIAIMSTQKQSFIAVFTLGAAILYNPIIRIHLNRDTWEILNICTIAVVLLASHALKKAPCRS